MKIFIQLLKEFWLPLLTATGWTLYNLFDKSETANTRDFVNIFGPSFFFVSWLVSQWYRVRKQQKVESGLVDIEQNVKKMLEDLDKRTKFLASHITGGDSFCYVAVAGMPGHLVVFSILNIGAHPLYNVSAKVIDMDLLNDGEIPFLERLKASETIWEVGDIVTQNTRFGKFSLKLGAVQERNFNIFYSARNGDFVQNLRFRRVDGLWRLATRIIKEKEILYEEIDGDYPRNKEGKVVW